MRKYLLLIGLLMASGMVWAQLPVHQCGDPGYLYSPPCSKRNGYQVNITHSRTWGGFSGSGFKVNCDTVVYGVSVPANNLEKFPYLWVYLLKATMRGGSRYYCDYVTARRELYCFMDRPPVPYAEMEFPTRFEDKVVTCPLFEFYFEPCEVDSGEIFFVGIVQSEYNDYNHFVRGEIYSPGAPIYSVMGYDSSNSNLDTTWWGIGINGFPNFNAPYPYPNDTGVLRLNHKPYAFMPILHPSLGEELNPRHVEPVTAGAVSGLRLDSVVEGHAMVSWDAAPASEWGPTGVNVDMYQVNYAEYRREYDTADVVETTDTSCMLPGVFDTTRYYKMRCRARCHHKCDIHDTVVWGPWGESYFYTGVLYPDTLPLECGEVEGLHYAGLRSGTPYFEWSRGLMQTQFEVAYAPDRVPWECDFVSGTSWRMPETVRPGVEYRVRVRAKCEHRCYIHDTTMWGPWSEEVRVTTPSREGLQEAKSDGTGLFSLMPNPARGRVTVRPELSSGQCPAVLTVTDAQGREVLRRTLEDGSPVTLELGAVASGTYLVTLKCRDGASGTRRLQVE